MSTKRQIHQICFINCLSRLGSFCLGFGRGYSWLNPQVQIKKSLFVLSMHGSVCASLQNRLNAMNTSVIHIQLYGFMPEAVPAFYEWLCCEVQGLS